MNARDKEDLRHVVLETLYVRHPAPVTTAGVRRIAGREIAELSEADTEAALEMLRGLDLVKFEEDALGATKYWSATSAGILAFERGEKPKAPPRHD